MKTWVRVLVIFSLLFAVSCSKKKATVEPTDLEEGEASESAKFEQLTLPQVLFSASPNPVILGEPVILTWTSTGAQQIVIEPGLGSFGPEGSLTLTPTQTTTYVATALGTDEKTGDSLQNSIPLTLVVNPVVLDEVTTDDDDAAPPTAETPPAPAAEPEAPFATLHEFFTSSVTLGRYLPENGIYNQHDCDEARFVVGDTAAVAAVGLDISGRSDTLFEGPWVSRLGLFCHSIVEGRINYTYRRLNTQKVGHYEYSPSEPDIFCPTDSILTGLWGVIRDDHRIKEVGGLCRPLTPEGLGEESKIAASSGGYTYSGFAYNSTEEGLTFARCENNGVLVGLFSGQVDGGVRPNVIPVFTRNFGLYCRPYRK